MRDAVDEQAGSTARAILAFVKYYLPGYKAGGPLRTLSNMVERLGGDFSFRVVALDRDTGDTQPYRGVAVGDWNPVGRAEVCYLPESEVTLGRLRWLIRKTPHEVLYFNSFFAPGFTFKPLLLRRLGLITRVPVVVAPRGEFARDALAIGRLKKRLYLVLVKLFGLYADVTWQASSPSEEECIRRVFGTDARVCVAPNLVSADGSSEPARSASTKQPGNLRIASVSRICRMKNLLHALHVLRALDTGRVTFDVYGPMEDSEYWAKCEEAIRALPPNVHVTYRGSIPHDQVGAVISEHDIFLLPTLGENFGHVILEALAVGCPVLISDRTPWRGLEEKGIGWDLPLEHPERFEAVLRSCVDMDAETHAEWSGRAMEHGVSCRRDEAALEQNKALFRLALRGGGSEP